MFVHPLFLFSGIPKDCIENSHHCQSERGARQSPSAEAFSNNEETAPVQCVFHKGGLWRSCLFNSKTISRLDGRAQICRDA